MIVVIVCLTRFIQPTVVVGESMTPNFKSLDYVLVNKFNPKLDYNDVITFPDDDRILIKRIVGKPGDHIEIKNNSVYRNGKKIKELYTKEKTEAGIDFNNVYLDENSYYVLGDHRTDSMDSRVFGTVNKNNIIGKVIIRIFRKPTIYF